MRQRTKRKAPRRASLLLLGIDVGTSGVKAGIFDAEGRLLGLGRAPCGIRAPHPGWAECDPAVWWNAAKASLRRACRAASVEPADLSAVGVDVLFPAVMLLDRNGRALSPAILYCDQRSLAQVRFIEKTVGRVAYETRIGNPLVPGTCAATSILWFRDERPELLSRACTIGWANTYLTHRLTGNFRADPSMAAVSGLIEAGNPWQWSAGLCETLGIEASLLPALAGSAEPAGAVCARAAAETGLRAGTPVACGAGDVPSAALGAAVAAPDAMVYIAGSSDCVAVPMPRPTADRRWVNCAYVPRGRWLGIGTTTSSGVSVEWFAREVLGRAGPNRLREMTRLAASSPPGANGVLFAPYLQGERTPIWDPLARGAFVGLTARTTKADLARAVFEGVAFGLRHVVDCLEGVTGRTVSDIRAVGGGTKNPLWNRIKSDVLRKPLRVLRFQESGVLGAALLGGLAAGVYASFDQAVAVAARVAGGKMVEPDPANAARYDELFGLFTQIHPATRDLSHGLAAT